MGNRFSKTLKTSDDPHVILEIDENATDAEIKKQYSKLVLKYHPDYNKNVSNNQLIEINEAYEKILKMRANPSKKHKRAPTIIDFSVLSIQNVNKMLENDFFSKVNQFVDIIIANEVLFQPDIKMPRFGNISSKNVAAFYDYYKSFKTKINFCENIKDANRYYLKKENSRLREDYNQNVRNLCKIVMKYDPRIKKTLEVPISAPLEIKKPEKKKERYRKGASDYTFFCEACKKGYMNKNTLINHLKSEKHRIMCIEKNMENKNIDDILAKWDETYNRDQVLDDFESKSYNTFEKNSKDNSFPYKNDYKSIKDDLKSTTCDSFSYNGDYEKIKDEFNASIIDSPEDAEKIINFDPNIFNDFSFKSMNSKEKDLALKIINKNKIIMKFLTDFTLTNEEFVEFFQEIQKNDNHLSQEKTNEYISKFIKNKNKDKEHSKIRKNLEIETINSDIDDIISIDTKNRIDFHKKIDILDSLETNNDEIKPNNNDTNTSKEIISMFENNLNLITRANLQSEIKEKVDIQLENVEKQSDDDKSYKNDAVKLKEKISNKNISKQKGKNNNSQPKKTRRLKKNVTKNIESSQLLKCSYCKHVFESRNQLFIHLKDDSCRNENNNN